MIDELRFYRIAPGSLADYLDLAGKVAIPLRGDRYGKLLGFWHAEIGAANCVYNLWQHTDLNSRERLRAKLQQQDVRRNDYLPHSQPLMREQLVRLMKPVIPLGDPPPGRTCTRSASSARGPGRRRSLRWPCRPSSRNRSGQRRSASGRRSSGM